MIAVKNLNKDYVSDDSAFRALNNVSFTINRGEFVAIMGPSGSGKSTLLHILSFLDKPTSGSYKFAGKSIDELDDKNLARVRNREMGFVFQAFNLLARSSVYENVELPLLYSGVSKNKREKLVHEAVEAVGLKDKIFQEAGKLSGGQKQRVAIARALVVNPNVIFADEPTGNLDSASGGQVMDILAKLNKAGKTIVLVTHETYTAEFANRAIHLKDGKIERDAPIGKNRHSKEDFIK
ncbi:MAG TPA: ABC transporter ATP-binding protein [Candidatus Paceibacterota bacterium]